MGKTTTYSFIDMSGVKQWSLLPQGEGHDPRDGGGRATQDAKAEDEVAYKTMSYLLLTTPTLGKLLLRCSTTYVHVGVSLKERELAGQQ